MSHENARELLKRDASVEEYEAVRSLWKAHSIAEDERDIEGLLATLTDDCVYEVLTTGHRWEGHAGATEFYTALLGAFPDVDFRLSDIVIGPQGVCERARFVGTHENDWLEFEATGQTVDFDVIIFFPWDRETGLFRGERVWFDPTEVGMGSS
ncbi:MAG: nuclear transport factor 2 family protein [Gemmatimonadota bacterium]|nr:nuclear transport factor 2 family protein [Gemmatimonadota bacterium]